MYADGEGLGSRQMENMQLLAERMVARHIRVAVPELDVRDRLVDQGEAKYDIELVERKMRCIAVVGAGGSDIVFMRSKELADELEAEFGRDADELERLRLVNNLDSVDDLETRLVALGKNAAGERKVREKIAEIYGVCYPSLPGYELLAHLLKHRFLDAIITFNFDELLDQSLDDELDRNEYVRVVSERDCGDDIVTDPDAPGYVPLYVKLHGTASEPESLRYTPDSYYALPPRIMAVVSRLLFCDHCVIANIGSNLGSFDFQRLLRVPRDLQVFTLGRHSVPASVVRKIDSERAAIHEAPPNAEPSAATAQGHSACRPEEVDWLLDCNASDSGCDELISDLTKAIKRTARTRADGLVDFRSVRRHTTLARLLGPQTLPRSRADDPAWVQHAWTDYCRQRAILELAFAGAKARGLLSMGPLALDRPARYFERYQQRTNRQGDDWRTLCSAAGLVESDDTPDVLLSRPELRRDPLADQKGADRRLNKFDVDKLARHVLARVKNPADEGDLEHLRTTLEKLQKQADIEFRMRDDRVCSKAFDMPATLPTATSRRAYTWLMLQGLTADDEVHVCAETGNWLLVDKARALLGRAGSIRVLLAFDTRRKRLEKAYGDRVRVAVVDPWRHNRHMTIVCRGGKPARAIYYARRQRASAVTAVYLSNAEDVDRLMRLYDDRWSEGVSFDFAAFKAALEARDITRLLSFYDPDAQWTDHLPSKRPKPPRTLRGHVEIAQHMKEVAKGTPDYTVSEESLQPEHVAFAVTASYPDKHQTRREVHLHLKRALIVSRIDVEVHGRRAKKSGDGGN